MNLSPDHLLQTYGYAAVLAGPLVESTGVPFPGETLLILGAAYSADTGRLSLPLVIFCAFAGAVMGDNLGYAVGRLLDRELVTRWGARVGLTERRQQLIQRFFERRGPLAVVVARFIALLRTFGALLAGVGEMPYRLFLPFNILGGAAWATAYGLLGFELGHAYQQASGAVGAATLALAVAAAVLILGGVVFFRRRLERWLLGE